MSLLLVDELGRLPVEDRGIPTTPNAGVDQVHVRVVVDGNDALILIDEDLLGSGEFGHALRAGVHAGRFLDQPVKLLVGVLAVVLAGVGLALFLERFDHSVHTPEEVEEAVKLHPAIFEDAQQLALERLAHVAHLVQKDRAPRGQLQRPSPLLVQFTDTTFTSDPGGVTSWAWDLDGDNVVDSTQQNMTGNVRLKLYKGNCRLAGVKSPNSLYAADLASFKMGAEYDPTDATGFIRLLGLPMKVSAIVNKNSRK